MVSRFELVNSGHFRMESFLGAINSLSHSRTVHSISRFARVLSTSLSLCVSLFSFLLSSSFFVFMFDDTYSSQWMRVYFEFI